MIRDGLGLSYDDVLLVPRRSSISSRKDIDVKATLTKNLIMNIPVISANMDTVTGCRMAITMARYGGIGIVHRFMTIEEQIAEVLKVKRSENIIIEQPYVLDPAKTIGQALSFMEEHEITGIPIVSEGKLVGMLTQRDVMFQDNLDISIDYIMTKKNDLITAKFGITLEEAKDILKINRIEKLPLVDDEGVLKGLITSKDILKIKQYPNAFKDGKGRLRVGAAIGVKKDDVERAIALYKAGVDVLVVDVAHGHLDLSINMTRTLVNTLGDIDIISGNVCTKEGTEDLISAGASCVKVGVGPGSHCSTRVIAGVGVPQLSAIIESYEIGKKYNVPIIADGGIKNSGDVTKALAAGASSVMIGGMFTGTDESPGVLIHRNGRKVKLSRGSSSFGVNVARRKMDNKEVIDDIVPEGVEGIAEYKGSVVDVINQLIGGLRSGMSYCGATNMTELRKNAEFIRITSEGMRESKPHDVDIIR
ncbi:MAG: IMP dehydrogenase [Candidatus Aenigmarchaeota archaeon]|nr:IMP dehydrogenase [Candidatus Aenigmarchaeota archaeon]